MVLAADYSVQTRAKPNNGVVVGGLDNLGEVGLVQRLTRITDVPLYGTNVHQRDRSLRRLYRLNGMEPITAAISTYVQKVQSTNWILEGPEEIATTIHAMLHGADYGQGYEEFIARTLTDYLTTDNGMFVELIGAGDPAGPMSGAVMGIAHLDSLRCRRTGNLEYPVVYTDLQGEMHKMHRTRIMFQSEMPDPDERRFGVGLCALSRVVSVAQRIFDWAEMSSEMMDNFPASGILVIKNMAKVLFDQQMAAYEAGRSSSEQEIYHGLITLFFQSGQVDNPVELVPFRQLWEGFSQKEMYEVMVDLVAMGFNIDRQELAPLVSHAMGSGAQATVLSQKGRGKGINAVLNLYERLFNRITPQAVTFKFALLDDEEDKVRAEILQLKTNRIISLYTAFKPQPSLAIDTVDQQKPATTSKQESLISLEEARYMLVKEGCLPRELYELDEPVRPDWQRFDDITAKAMRRFGPSVAVNKEGIVRLPQRRWRNPHVLPRLRYA